MRSIYDMKRNSAIEIVRVIAAALVVALHFNEFFGTGVEHLSNFMSIYVEFFFMISGFFMMLHLDKRSDEAENSWSFTLRKIKTFWAPLCIVNFGHLFLNCCMSNVNSIGGVLEKLWHFKWEFLLLQCAGFIQNPSFNQDYLVGPSWYLSALVMATIVLYPIAKHDRRVYTNVLCPIVIVVAYCGFAQAYGNMNIGNGFRFIVMDAFVRALAGICCGSVCYSAYLWLENKKSGKTMCTIDCVSWMMIPISILIGIFGKDDSGLFMILPFGAIIVSSMLNRTPIARALNGVPPAIAAFLGKFSLYLYLTHWTAIFAVMYFFPEADSTIKILLSAAITLAYSFFLYFIDKKRKSETVILIICLVLFSMTVLTCGFLTD